MNYMNPVQFTSLKFHMIFKKTQWSIYKIFEVWYYLQLNTKKILYAPIFYDRRGQFSIEINSCSVINGYSVVISDSGILNVKKIMCALNKLLISCLNWPTKCAKLRLIIRNNQSMHIFWNNYKMADNFNKSNWLKTHKQWFV